MKKFTFPLRRVLDWRRTESRLEELKLGRLSAELRGIEERIAHARAEQFASITAVATKPGATGADLAALDSFKKAVSAECARLENQAAGCRKKIARQIEAVAGKRRDARLLEKLEQRKLTTWKLEFDRELDRQAEESHLSRLKADS
jgi:flagellar export protein FliJ